MAKKNKKIITLGTQKKAEQTSQNQSQKKSLNNNSGADFSEEVPLMFQAQVPGRCQLHLVEKKGSQATEWAKEWTKPYPEPPQSEVQSNTPKKADPFARPAKNIQTKNQLNTKTDWLTEPPQFGREVETKSYKISWRLLTNSGVDDSIIRPVIGAKGYPHFPGSSMKGAFRRACETDEQALLFCGQSKTENADDTQQGILRFHGGYPVDTSWIKGLVDIIHPQGDKQVIQDETTGAKSQISLNYIEIKFGISSTIPSDKVDWETVWKIWERALGHGIGSRVSAGYGRFEGITPQKEILTVHLKGQGIASTLLDNTHEFRVNMFKAALRGHTLRLLGGLTNANNAKKLTEKLWGGIDGDNGAVLGLLGVSFDYETKNLNFQKHSYTPSYELEQGTLHIFLNRETPKEQELIDIAQALIQFTILFGGFGKSWRRVDHSIFFESYVKQKNKPMIGCHWQFIQDSESLYLPVQNLKQDVANFINTLRAKLKKWANLNTNQFANNWREAWYPYQTNSGGVQVWGRIASGDKNSQAIYWFHQEYNDTDSIKKQTLTGSMGNTGRIWHRMYPYCEKLTNGKIKPTEKYVEFLTIFPDDSPTTQKFLIFLSQESDFTQLW
jgi:CRISPR-associated protein Cmr6